jgi:hypothetical protein
MAIVVDGNDVEQPVPHPSNVLYIPNFLDVLVEEAEDNLTYKMTHKELLLKDWITSGLSTKIQSFFPVAEQIDKSNGT